MGVSYYVEFEHRLAKYDPSLEIGGKPLARAIKSLDALCDRLGVRTLMSFYSESNAEAFEKVGDELPEGMDEGTIEWSVPAEGLRTVMALIAQLTIKPGDLHEPDPVLDDLRALEKILGKAQQHGTRFRLRIDI